MPGFAFRDADNVLRIGAGLSFRDNDGVPRALSGGKFRDNDNVLRQFWPPGGGTGTPPGVPPLTLTEDSSGDWNGTKYTTATAATVTTAPKTVTPVGGVGPFSYAWTRTGGDSSVTAASPAAASTPFGATVAANDFKVADFKCEVTDSTGAKATANVHVTLYCVFTDPGGGAIP